MGKAYRKYFNARLLDIDVRFARVLDHLFVATFLRQRVRNDKAYRFLKNVRGSPPDYNKFL